MKGPMPTVVCVLRGGGDFSPEHVRALRAGVGRWWPAGRPLRFVALTDTAIWDPGVEERMLITPLKGWWAKMALYGPENDDLGPILYFDLDTVIVGPLHDIIRRRPLTLLSDFYTPMKAQSGMMMLPVVDRQHIAAGWKGLPRQHSQRVRGDGEYLDQHWRDADRWQDVLPGQVVSYKAHVRHRTGDRMPDGARVVCYHGTPRPWHTQFWTSAPSHQPLAPA